MTTLRHAGLALALPLALAAPAAAQVDGYCRMTPGIDGGFPDAYAAQGCCEAGWDAIVTGTNFRKCSSLVVVVGPSVYEILPTPDLPDCENVRRPGDETPRERLRRLLPPDGGTIDCAQHPELVPLRPVGSGEYEHDLICVDGAPREFSRLRARSLGDITSGGAASWINETHMRLYHGPEFRVGAGHTAAARIHVQNDPGLGLGGELVSGPHAMELIDDAPAPACFARAAYAPISCAQASVTVDASPSELGGCPGPAEFSFGGGAWTADPVHQGAVDSVAVRCSADPACTHAIRVERDLSDRVTDGDGDQLPDCVEIERGTDPAVRDNDVFARADLFVIQAYLGFLRRLPDRGGLCVWSEELESGRLDRAGLALVLHDSSESSGLGAPLARLYLASFLRPPDPSGHAFWVEERRGGTSFEEIADAFAGSDEFVARYGALDEEGFVERVYENVLGRPAEPAGLRYWADELLSGRRTRGEVMLALSESAEHRAASASEVLVALAYLALLERAPEPEGFAFWDAELDAGRTPRELLELLLASDEYRARFLPEGRGR